MRKVISMMLVLAMVLTLASFPAFADGAAITLKGANIRLANADLTAGLRFGATLNKEAVGIENRTWYPRIDGIEVGMFLLPVEMLGEGETLIDYLENGGEDALKIEARKGLSQNATTLTYTAVLTGIPEESYGWAIAATPYVYVDGVYTYYEEDSKSYAQVAQAAIDSYNDGNPNNLSAEDVLALEEIVEIADSNEEPAGPALITGITVTAENFEIANDRPLSNLADGVSGLTTWDENYGNYIMSTEYADAGDGTSTIFSFTFSLGAKYDVESFFIGNEWNGKDIKNATLYGSNDGVEWSQIKTNIKTAWGAEFAGGNYYYATLANASYKYFKLDVTQLSAAGAVRFHEVEFIGTLSEDQSDELPAEPALITGINVSAENFEVGNDRPLSNLADGVSGLTTWTGDYGNYIESTEYADAGDGTSAVFSLIFNLGKKYDVSSFFIGNEWNGKDIKNATLYGSNDGGATWTEVKTGIKTAWGGDFAGGNFYQTTLTNAVYSMFKLDVTQLSAAGKVRFHEIEFIGVPVKEAGGNEGGETPDPEEPTPDEPEEPTPDEPGAVTEQKVTLTVDNLKFERYFPDSDWRDDAVFTNKEFAVDGDYTTYTDSDQYKDPATALGFNIEVIVDLGAAKNISKINVYGGAEHYGSDWWSYAAPVDMEILVAGEDGVYTSVYTHEGTGDEAERLDAVELDYTAEGAGIRYIKFVTTKAFRRPCVAEIEIFEMTQAGDAGEQPAPSLIYYNVDSANGAATLNGSNSDASALFVLPAGYDGFEINGSYKVDAETLRMLTTVSCIGDGTIAYKDYREFPKYIATVNSSWGQYDNEGYGEDNYGEQITSAPVSKLSDPVYMSMVLASEAPTYQDKNDKPEEHQNNGANMHAPSEDTVFDRINALGAIYVNKALKNELKANYKNEQVTVCIGNIKLLIRTTEGWIERTVAVPTAGFGMLYALPWQLEWELGSDAYANQLCINVDNNITQYASYSAIKMDVADFLENKRGNWWGGTSFDERTFHFWGNVHTLSELGISEDTEVIGVIASYEVWVEEEELAPYFVASVGADWRLESGATRQAFAGHQIVTTTDKQILFGHSFGAEDYENYVAPDLDDICSRLGIQ